MKSILIENIARVAKAAIHKLPGKLSLNVSFVVPVCPAHDHQDHHDSHSLSLQDM